MIALLILAAPPPPAPVTSGTNPLVVSLIGLATALVGLLVWFLRDRRKSRAEAAVAEATVRANIEKRDIDVQDARLVYIQRQMDMERGFHQQQLADRDTEITRQRAELQRRDERIAALLSQVEELETQLGRVTESLNDVRNQLNELANPKGPH